MNKWIWWIVGGVALLWLWKSKGATAALKPAATGPTNKNSTYSGTTDTAGATWWSQALGSVLGVVKGVTGGNQTLQTIQRAIGGGGGSSSPEVSGGVNVDLTSAIRRLGSVFGSAFKFLEPRTPEQQLQIAAFKSETLPTLANAAQNEEVNYQAQSDLLWSQILEETFNPLSVDNGALAGEQTWQEPWSQETDNDTAWLFEDAIPDYSFPE